MLPTLIRLKEAARQKAFQEELKGVTFHPKLNNIHGIQSKLKILTEPGTYLQRLEVRDTIHRLVILLPEGVTNTRTATKGEAVET